MAAAERNPNPALTKLLEDDAARFHFFRAVQLLHRLSPGSVPVGELGPAASEPIRFSHDPSMTFHAGDIAKIEPRVVRNGHVFARVTTTFLGLLGAVSPLASHMTEEVLRTDSDDSTVREFYDLFHHRVLSLLYRAWKKHRFGAGFRSDASDAFSRRALALVGVDIAGTVSRHGLPPGELLALAPLASQRTRTARSLQLVLERLLPGAQIRIEGFVARRVRIDEEQHALVGVRNNVLGRNLTIGRTVLDRSGAFRVVVGPVDYELYEAFAPGGRHHDRLRRIVDQFSGGVLEPELELQMRETAAPRFQLGSARGAVLGKNTQLMAKQRGMRMRVMLSSDPERAKPRVVTDDEA